MINLLGSSTFSSLLGIVGAVLVLMFMVTIHELGHYTAGKLLKFKINEFSVGMGPKLLSRTKKNGEVISLRALPLGGFCAFEGEDGDDEDEKSTDILTFNQQKPWKRLIVLFSGAFFNILTALIIGVILFSCYGNTAVSVKEVYQYAPSENVAMLREGDIVKSVNGREVYIAGDFSNHLSSSESYDIVVIRDGQEVELKGLVRGEFSTTVVDYSKIKFTATTDNGEDYTLGKSDTIYSINDTILSVKGQFATVITDFSGENVNVVVKTATGETVLFNDISADLLRESLIISEYVYSGLGVSVQYVIVDYTFGEALGMIVPYCFDVSTLLLRTLGGIITGMVSLDQVGGPITTISVASEIVSLGLANILNLIVLLSLNLAVFNLLPVPALDGCRMVFVVVEWIRGKPINRKIENVINVVGFFLLIGMMILFDLMWFL